MPGDVISPEEGLRLPCDCLMISGTVIVDESTLTGESDPVFKAHVEKMDVIESLFLRTDQAAAKKNMLFSGTRIVQALP